MDFLRLYMIAIWAAILVIPSIVTSHCGAVQERGMFHVWLIHLVDKQSDKP